MRGPHGQNQPRKASSYLPVLAAYTVVLIASGYWLHYKTVVLGNGNAPSTVSSSSTAARGGGDYLPVQLPTYDPAAPNQYYAKLLAEQKRVCGELCSWDESKLAQPFPNGPAMRTLHTPQQLVKSFVSKPVDCRKLFNPEVERVLEPQSVLPSHFVPRAMYQEYSFNGKIEIIGKVMEESHKDADVRVKASQAYLGGETYFANWTKEVIEQQRKEIREGILGGSYSTRATNKLLEFLKQVGIAGKDVLVVGSERPWVEVACLEAGAKTVSTLEYGRIYTNHPQLKTYVPSEFSEMMHQGKLRFDVGVSFSSLEHPGLGRYGDGLNPWGDVIAMAKLSCVVKPGGIAVIGVPDRDTNRQPLDKVLFPLNRVFGAIRLPYLLTNWKAFLTEEGHHSHVLVAATNERENM